VGEGAKVVEPSVAFLLAELKKLVPALTSVMSGEILLPSRMKFGERAHQGAVKDALAFEHGSAGTGAGFERVVVFEAR
jgi:hypothetical protein